MGEARCGAPRRAVRSCSELYSRTAIDFVAMVFVVTNATARSAEAAAEADHGPSAHRADGELKSRPGATRLLAYGLRHHGCQRNGDGRRAENTPPSTHGPGTARGDPPRRSGRSRRLDQPGTREPEPGTGRLATEGGRSAGRPLSLVCTTTLALSRRKLAKRANGRLQRRVEQQR